MIANTVSPASLYNSESSNPGCDMMLAMHNSAMEESQLSQTSLFSSEVSNSMELFSQPSNFSQSQSQATTVPCMRDRHAGVCVQEEGRGRAMMGAHSQQPPSNPLQGNSQSSQVSCGRKYYMRYLSQAPLGGRGEREGGRNTTPLCGEGKSGDTAFSRTSFEAWKAKQQEKLENKQIIDGMTRCTKDMAKEVKDSLEHLRMEMEALVKTGGKQQQAELPGMADHQMRSVFAQLLQGQAEIKQQLADLQRQCSQQREGLDALHTHISDSLSPEKLVKSVESTLKEHIRECVSEMVGDPLKHCTSKLEETMVIVREGAVRVGCVMKAEVRDDGVRGEAVMGKGVRNYQGGLSDSDNALVPIDQAVPSVSVLEEDVGDAASTVPYRRTLTRAGATGVSQVKGVVTALPTTGGQWLHAEHLSTDADHPTTMRHSCTQGDLTSQGSVSTPYDIDLTQQSPSVCSQIISQHLERHSGAGTKKGLQQRSTREHIATPMGTPLSGLKRRKLQQTSTRGVGRRRGGGKRRVGATQTQSPYIKRRSQRIRKQTQLVQCRRAEEDNSSDLMQPSSPGGVGGVTKKVTTTGSLPSCLHATVEKQRPIDSPMNALAESLYSQGDLPSAITPLVSTQPLPTSTAVQPPTGKFQRSSEAARRRMRIIAGMSSSDTVLKEISASLKSQLDTRPSP